MKIQFLTLAAVITALSLGACAADPRYTYRNGSDPVQEPKRVETTQVTTVKGGEVVPDGYVTTEETYTEEHVRIENANLADPFHYKRAY